MYIYIYYTYKYIYVEYVDTYEPQQIEDFSSPSQVEGCDPRLEGPLAEHSELRSRKDNNRALQYEFEERFQVAFPT